MTYAQEARDASKILCQGQEGVELLTELARSVGGLGLEKNMGPNLGHVNFEVTDGHPETSDEQ